ncbi:MAG: hypothetical protein E6K54_07900 [Gammaproteobacteria bacterium]|nr:MAG: hypothetical protein E6K54_07900 [Gammaproteobacteria bacterium]
MRFNNNNCSVIVKYHHEFNRLPKKNLITHTLLKGVHYGFYRASVCKEVDENDESYLFIGNSLEVPDETWKIVNIPAIISTERRGRITDYFIPDSSVRSYIRSYFNKSADEDRFNVNCIYHSPDRNPSMCIDVVKGVFYCFTCRASGTTLKLICKIRATKCGKPKHVSCAGVK